MGSRVWSPTAGCRSLHRGCRVGNCSTSSGERAQRRWGGKRTTVRVLATLHSCHVAELDILEADGTLDVRGHALDITALLLIIIRLHTFLCCVRLPPTHTEHEETTSTSQGAPRGECSVSHRALRAPRHQGRSMLHFASLQCARVRFCWLRAVVHVAGHLRHSQHCSSKPLTLAGVQ